jgi:hypothetical protein
MVSEPHAAYLLNNELNVFIIQVYFLIGLESSHLKEQGGSCERY